METYDTVYRLGDAVTFIFKHKPYVDLGISPCSNEYRDAICVTLAIYGTTVPEPLLYAIDMVRIPNRPGWYYTRYQTNKNMKPGVYTAIFTSVTKIDGIEYTNRAVQEFEMLNDGIV